MGEHDLKRNMIHSLSDEATYVCRAYQHHFDPAHPRLIMTVRNLYSVAIISFVGRGDEDHPMHPGTL